MQQKSLVSIVIPTWQRNELLVECLEHIRNQTYKKIEIIVVSDGIQKLDNYNIKDYFDCEVIELGRNWSGLMPKSFGIAPLMVGYLMATGDYIMPWCDDERALVAYHIEKLVYLLDSDPDVKFVYPRVKIWRNGNPNGPETAIIGTVPARENQITHYLFRASNLWEYGLPDWNTHPVDWALINKWLSKLEGNDTYLMLDDVTFEHRLDQ